MNKILTEDKKFTNRQLILHFSAILKKVYCGLHLSLVFGLYGKLSISLHVYLFSSTIDDRLAGVESRGLCIWKLHFSTVFTRV